MHSNLFAELSLLLLFSVASSPIIAQDTFTNFRTEVGINTIGLLDRDQTFATTLRLRYPVDNRHRLRLQAGGDRRTDENTFFQNVGLPRVFKNFITTSAIAALGYEYQLPNLGEQLSPFIGLEGLYEYRYRLIEEINEADGSVDGVKYLHDSQRSHSWGGSLILGADYRILNRLSVGLEMKLVGIRRAQDELQTERHIREDGTVTFDEVALDRRLIIYSYDLLPVAGLYVSYHFSARKNQ